MIYLISMFIIVPIYWAVDLLVCEVRKGDVMKTVRYLSLQAAGFLALTFGTPAFAHVQGEAGGSDTRKLVDIIIAEDKTTLVDSLVSLETDADRARKSMENADLELYETKIDAAGTLLKLVEAENTVKQARLVVKRSQDAVHGGEMALEDLRALPTSQETNSDIEFLEDELATLKRIAVGAAGDFHDAKRQLKAATLAAKDAEFSVGQAEDAYLIEKRDLSALE